MATRSKAFGGKSPRKSHLVTPSGGMGAEIYDVRKDVEEAFTSGEGRPASDEYPELDYIDGAGPAAAGGDMAMVGRYLLGGQTFASVTLGASLDIIARTPGDAGNDYSVEVVDSAAGGLAVTFAADKLEIDLGGAASTEDQIATAVNAVPVGAPLRANSGGGPAFGTASEVSLAGGSGEGWRCTVGGFDAPIKFDTGAATSSANLDETDVIVTVPALAPIVATDKAKVYAVVDGVRTDLGVVAVE